MSPTRAWIRASLFALLFVSVTTFALGDRCTAGLRGLKVGDTAPDFSLVDTAGEPFQLSKQAGTTVVLLFWTPSTTMSRQAIAAFNALAATQKNDAVLFIAIKEIVEKENSEQSPEDGARAAVGRTARVLPDVDRTVFGNYGLIVLPSTCVIAPDGRLANYIPMVDGRYPALVKASIDLAEGTITPEQYNAIAHPTNRKPDAATVKAKRITRLAHKYYERGSWNLAEEAYRKALQQKKPFSDASVGLGYTLLRQKLPEEALAAFEKIDKEDPLRRRALLGSGIALRLLGRGQEAKTLLDRVTKLPPPDGRAYYELGLIAESEEKRDAALVYYRKALSITYRND